MSPKIIAHRGASGEAPENTLSAIHAALRKSVDFIEIDVRLSKDGVPVVIHDDSISRITGDLHSLKVDELLSHEIREFDVGTWFGEEFKGEKIPLLSDLFAFDWAHTGLMIEIKESLSPDAVVVEAVFKVLESAEKLPSELVIGSFSPSILAEVQRRSASSHVKVNFIGILEELEFIDRFSAIGVTHLAIWDKMLSLSLIQSLKERDIEIWSFTVDDIDMIHLLTSMNLDGLISNHPDRLYRNINF